MEKTKKTSKAKNKHKAKLVINVFFCKFYFADQCRHHRREKKNDEAPIHNFGENGDQFGRANFGPSSKGPST